MPTNTNVTNLKINTLTEAQYDTAVQGGVIGANELSILTDAEAGQVIQVTTLPTASADELGNIYQFIGTTDANYTNGYFYKCVSDGATPAVYSWTAVEVQAGGGLPSQTGNAGKFLTTDGTDASWSKSIKTNSGAVTLWQSGRYGDVECLKLGYNSSSSATDPNKGVRLIANNNELSVVNWGDSYTAKLSADVVIPGIGLTKTLGSPTNVNTSWNITYTKNINAGSGAGNIAVPTVAGSMAVQVSTVPTASSTLEGQIYQFTGATGATYTNGHFYKCVSDGGNPATYSWTAVEVQASSGLQNTATGIDSLTILGTVATTAESTNVGISSEATNQGTAYGSYAKATGQYAVALGRSANSSGASSVAVAGKATANNAICVGGQATAIGAIQIGNHIQPSATSPKNSDANTLKVANANGNFEMMSADGTIPHARLTNAVQSTTVTIATTDWSSNTASVTVSGLAATSVVWVAPDNASQSAYTTAGVYASSQSADTLTFTCTQTPTASLTINVVFC